jgi:predicted CoA-binding protein
MPRDRHSDDDIRTLLSGVRTIALLGASPNPARPSNRVMRFLLSQGYTVYPVNPGHTDKQIHGAQVYGRLADVPQPVDMVDVFRASEYVAGVVDEALALPQKPKVIWTQLGVHDDKAAAKAEGAGLTVVMDRCPAIEIPRLGIPAQR